MSDLLHWYARAHGPRSFRIMQAARAGELDRERADAASAAQDATRVPSKSRNVVAAQPDLMLEVSTCEPPRR